jgi:peptide deformylase
MIIINDEDALRVKCEDATLEEAQLIVTLLEADLKESARLGRPGVGLAAPQIGIAKKVAIVRLDDIKVDLVNCKLEMGYDPAIFKGEGCLSFPNRYEDTIRYQEIVIVNNLIYPHKFIATGITAVVCQHEIGHWNSDLFLDHLSPKPQPIVIKTKVRPNDPCSCGSKRKYKKCCGK